MQVPTDVLGILVWITNMIPVFLALASWGALVAMVINLLKGFGVVKDGDAPKWVLGFNVVGLVVFLALGLFKGVTPEQFDNVAKIVVALLVAVLGFVTQFKGAQFTHETLTTSQIPGLGKSFSGEIWAAKEAQYEAKEKAAEAKEVALDAAAPDQEDEPGKA
jgi:hypothetical protein